MAESLASCRSKMYSYCCEHFTLWVNFDDSLQTLYNTAAGSSEHKVHALSGALFPF